MNNARQDLLPDYFVTKLSIETKHYKKYEAATLSYYNSFLIQFL